MFVYFGLNLFILEVFMNQSHIFTNCSEERRTAVHFTQLVEEMESGKIDTLRSDDRVCSYWAC